MDRNCQFLQESFLPYVALRKESVDRNAGQYTRYVCVLSSLSARRAWIEIAMTGQISVSTVVALRKESVDRNLVGGVNRTINIGRSPQGERG